MRVLSLLYDFHLTIVILSLSALMEEYSDGKARTLHNLSKRVSSLQDTPPEALIVLSVSKLNRGN
jgi:hypothetical protein